MHVIGDAPVFISHKRSRLDARIDLAPLLAPVGANFCGAAHVTTFESSGPRHIGRHKGEHGVNIARVESGVSGAQQFNLGGISFWYKCQV